MHAHPPARAYRLRDRSGIRGKKPAAPWPKSNAVGPRPKAVALNASAGAVWLMEPRKTCEKFRLNFSAGWCWRL
ncbi:hypothetical protein E6B08_06885 [Pseudomonas putida]|uniref:Uncharacterized protein n=1 Tax=Pseudomonas putida TaxID=303 RepID=A0A4D6X543_PSEPU|nr:hypothetical protein E6B08_06885 [Pseudomonas putida]